MGTILAGAALILGISYYAIICPVYFFYSEWKKGLTNDVEGDIIESTEKEEVKVMYDIKECTCPYCEAVENDHYNFPDTVDFDADMIHRTYEVTCWNCGKEYLYVEDYEITTTYSEKN